MPDFPTLTTDRLTLRMWRANDFEAYTAIATHPAVTESLKRTFATKTDVWRSFATVVGHWHLRGYGVWAVEEKASGEVVGVVGCIYPEGWPDFEICWTLRPASWGRGYATEAARAAVRYAFEVLNRPHVISLIAPENVRSRRVAERLGEVADGTAVVGGHECLVYRLTREGWAERCASPT